MNAALNDLMAQTFTTYYGCLIEKRGDKYYACRKLHNSLDEAKAAIDKSLSNISKTIR